MSRTFEVDGVIYLTIDSAAHWLHVNPAEITRMVRAGELEYVVTNADGRVWVPKPEILRRARALAV